jgi:drug/metabolite transporter (DMT)-like permease
VTTAQPKLDATSWGLIAILSILWGGAFVLIEIGMRSYPPNSLVFIRMALAVPPMLIVMRIMGARMPHDAANWGRLFVVGVLNCALPFMLFFWGQKSLDSGYASILNATTPLWGVIATHFMTMDEKLTPTRMLGVLVGLAGIIVMIGPNALQGFSQNLFAQIACLVSTVFYSIAAIYGRRLSTSGMAPITIATGQTAAAALFMLPVVLLVDQPWTMAAPSLESTIAGLALALFSTALAYILYFRLIDRAGASNAQLVAFVMPVIAVTLGILVLGERLSGGQLGGAALIFAGLVILDGRVFRKLDHSPTRLNHFVMKTGRDRNGRQPK